MGPARLDPFALAFGPFVPDRFARIRGELLESGIDGFDRDAWSLARPVAELLRELRPDGGLGEAVEELVALAHAGFLFWEQGERLLELSRPALDDLLRGPPGSGSPATGRWAYYTRLPPRRVWGTPVAEAPPEPLDGWFTVADGDRLQLVAIFGLLPARIGFAVVHAGGPDPGVLARPDGTPLFAPVLPGGEAAGLWSLVGQEELLELGWRVHRRILAAGGPVPGQPEGSA